MAKVLTAKTLLSRHVSRRDRILLVNPPVEETRYSWIRWNQPLDLLKIGGHLRERIRCSVELLDFMKPDADGHVLEQWLPGSRRSLTLGDHRYPMRRYGAPYERLTDWVINQRAINPKLLPTQVWITSLCAYWFESVAQLCRVARQALPEAQVTVIGQYARLLPNHAADTCAADVIVRDSLPLEDCPAAIDLYGDDSPSFMALRLNPKAALLDIKTALQRGLMDFTFFETDVFHEDGEPLARILSEASQLDARARFHVICGASVQTLTRKMARLVAADNIVELHLEAPDNDGVDPVALYTQARAYLAESGMQIPSRRLSGFVWLGRPTDALSSLVKQCLCVLANLGSFILKPYTPTPGSATHLQHETYLRTIPQQQWSPHLFPFSDLTGISRSEYHDLYRLAAFLNEKVRSTSFNFLNGTLGSDLLRESLRREVWKLEPTTISTAN